MMETIVEYELFFGVAVLAMTVGVIGSLVSHRVLKRLRREGMEIHTSEHRLLKLIKAKYEHANMLTERVKNVRVFVDKYLYGYKIAGICFYTWLALPLRMLWLTLFFGCLNGTLHLLTHGICEGMFRSFAGAGAGSILLFLCYAMSGQSRKVEEVRTYIVDYLENVCANRYARPTETKQPEEAYPAMEKQVEEVKAVVEEEAQDKEKEGKIQEETQQMRIREILEEFLA